MSRRTVFVALLTMMLFLAPGVSLGRWMNANTGRFQTMDSYEGDQEDPPSLHRYMYVRDNPIGNRDPSGRDANESITVGNLDCAPDSFALPLISASLRSSKGTGGPDVTQTLRTTLYEVQMAFWGWAPYQKAIAAEQLTTFPGWWSAPSGFLRAWDIVPLCVLGEELANLIPSNNGRWLECGVPPWDYTVAVNGKCYFAGSVNYAQWGAMFKAIHEYYVSIDSPEADCYSLGRAQTLARWFKSAFHGDQGETAREAVDFVAYGYNGSFPTHSLFCHPSSEACKAHDFDWVWEPYQPRKEE